MRSRNSELYSSKARRACNWQITFRGGFFFCKSSIFVIRERCMQSRCIGKRVNVRSRRNHGLVNAIYCANCTSMRGQQPSKKLTRVSTSDVWCNCNIVCKPVFLQAPQPLHPWDPLQLHLRDMQRRWHLQVHKGHPCATSLALAASEPFAAQAQMKAT
jgi:hypothetical protein